MWGGQPQRCPKGLAYGGGASLTAKARQRQGKGKGMGSMGEGSVPNIFTPNAPRDWILEGGWVAARQQLGIDAFESSCMMTGGMLGSGKQAEDARAGNSDYSPASTSGLPDSTSSRDAANESSKHRR